MKALRDLKDLTIHDPQPKGEGLPGNVGNDKCLLLSAGGAEARGDDSTGYELSDWVQYSNSCSARLVHQIISMIEWIQISTLSTKNSL